MTKPWLLIDIDGVLNPTWGNLGVEENGARVEHVPTNSGTFRVVFPKGHAEMLLAMQDSFNLAWCTWWMDEANGSFRELAGLPELPVVRFDRRRDGFSKVPGILRFVGDTPFVWLDDDVTIHEAEELRESHSSFMVVEVNPYSGLTQEHLNVAREWEEELDESSQGLDG